MSAPNTTSLLLAMEDDVRGVRELLAVIEALANHAHKSGGGLDPHECRGLYRLAEHTADLAGKVETAWEQALAAGAVPSMVPR